MNKITRRIYIVMLLGSLLTFYIVMGQAFAESGAIKTVKDAQLAIDHAWEVYHSAALSGSIASPQLQVKIEQDLRKVRSLLVEARDIAEGKDPDSIDPILLQIKKMTENIIEASQKPKP